MSDFHPMRAPDYGMQTWGEGLRSSSKTRGEAFNDPNKQPAYEKQGDASAPTVQQPEAEEREGRRGRVGIREPSGATGARSSSSVSRDRRGRPSDIATEVKTDARTASLSPSRAMGARSTSIDRSRMYSGMNTLEGIGSSMAPSVNPDALDDRRGRPGYQNENNTGGLRQAVGSPTGARSVSAQRSNSISRTIQEE